MLPQYKPGEAETYCIDRGWLFKRSGNELVLNICPYCGAEGKMYISNEKGVFSCKRGSCDKKGNFYQLTREFGGDGFVQPPTTKAPAKPVSHTVDQLLSYELDLAESQTATAYLLDRGITMQTASAWHLGLKNDADGLQWLMIPYLNGRTVADVKYRTLPPAEKRFKRIGGGESILFGQHLLLEPSDSKILYLVEGEIDAMTLWQHGFSPVLSTTAGAGTFKAQWYDAILAYDPATIVVCYDSDAAGQRGAEAILKKFEDRSCLNLVLPEVKDANEYFRTHSADDFRALVADCKPAEIDDVLSMSTVLDRLEHQMFFMAGSFDGLPSQFPDVNTMIAGGYWNGQLVTFSGPSGTGKTSLVLQELLQMSQFGIPSYLLCLEMPVEMMMRKIIEHKFGIPMLKQTQEHLEAYGPTIRSWQLHLGQKNGTLEETEKKIRDAVKKNNIKIVAFDNINYMVRSIEHESQELARVMKTFKEMAKDLGIPIIMIVQPRKFDDDQRAMTAGDMKGSGSLRDDSDTVILLHRKRIKTDLKDFGQNQGFIGNLSPYTMVRVDKARYSGGGETYLYFDGARSTYRELTPGEWDNMKKGS